MSELTEKTCPFCGKGKLHEDQKKQRYELQGQSITILQPGIYCDTCDEAILEPEHLRATRRELQTFRARIEGILSPDEIKKIRKKIGLNQRQAGTLFGGGKNAFSRYEQGELAPPKAVSLLLSLLDRHPQLCDELFQTVAPRQSP
ncbi:type II toxin-antitoxin system MqsA family antitoxin [Pseudidiomarina donghaiensis]|uniref:Type II toxin-antitoxin system MqsA family antitoxin n=1 Tax=Pseudidiomarina donghaiensis TaxID=519452 RepID=A0A432XCI6_9GAMM|nr:type II toxin-antitoxin system MqsA family antitoxin [Pseudidiomarina donghaiensis]RUO46461.1 type II toxin-antitoxin system MqsA family antitoxin [Pseudidiomarina donghaiensis]SFV24747.1 HTH-type transcriptional regulator / antitoxin MqsA [Pseudidiomarina donghaiensis]